MKWQLGINIKDNGPKVKRMVLEFMSSRMEMFMKENSKMEIDKGKGVTLGQIKAIIKVNG